MNRLESRNGNRHVLNGAFLLSGISIRILGDVYIGELILSIFIISSLLIGKKISINPVALKLIKAAIVWLVANSISSIYREKSFSLTLIAIFTVILTALSFAAIAHFFETYPNRIMNFVLVYCLGKFIGVIIQPGSYTSALPWKFGFGEPLILATLVFVSISGKAYLTYLGIGLMIIISLTNESRTLAFTCLFALSAYILRMLKILKSSKKLFVLIVGLIPLLYNLYLQVALSGSLGLHEVDRAQILTSTDLGPFAARKEFVFSVQAFIQSPFLGYGFDPLVSRDLIMQGYKTLLDLGLNVKVLNDTDLPIHSFLMSALVQGGLFAGLFWIYSLKIVGGSFLKLTDIEVSKVPLYTYVAATLVDKILFSPFGALERVNSALFLVLLINIHPKTEKSD